MNDIPAFALHSWGDVFALLAVGSLLLGGLTWGLKLEFDVRDLRRRMRDMEHRVNKRHILDNGD